MENTDRLLQAANVISTLIRIKDATEMVHTNWETLYTRPLASWSTELENMEKAAKVILREVQRLRDHTTAVKEAKSEGEVPTDKVMSLVDLGLVKS